MAEFDPHRIIRKLAEAEWECPHHDTYLGSDLAFHGDGCAECRGTGRIMPFASLREALCVMEGPHWHHAVYYNSSRGKPCSEGWLPEPAVEKACWRVWWVVCPQTGWEVHRLVNRWWRVIDLLDRPLLGDYDSSEEAVLRAAEAWLDAQMKEAQRR